MPRRRDLEDQLLGLLRMALPGSEVVTLPTGGEPPIITDAVIVVAYCESTAGQLTGDFVQPDVLSWEITVAARNYRSDGHASDAALDLLESVETAVVGELLGGRRIEKIADRIVDIGVPGTIAYVLRICVASQIRKV